MKKEKPKVDRNKPVDPNDFNPTLDTARISDALKNTKDGNLDDATTNQNSDPVLAKKQ